MKKLIALFLSVLSVLLILSLAACANSGGGESSEPSASEATSPDAQDTPATQETPAAQDPTPNTADPVTIRFFSNLTDRDNGQGMIEQMLIDSYVDANPNVTIEVETLDDEAYKTKFKAYALGTDMPDLLMVWGQPSFLDEVIDAGLLAELNPSDYSSYGFIEGSLAGFSKNGKLYGLARNTDVMGFYYNKKLFTENGWQVPATYDDLLTLAGKIKDAGFIPVSMAGADKWPLSIYIHDISVKLGGDVKDTWKASISNADFSDPVYKQTLDWMHKTVDAGLFQTGFETSDYGTALNLFANGQAAMFYMGSWEMSMATNMDVIEDVRNNIGAFMMPPIAGGAGKVTDIAAWNGGGYAVSANSPVKAETIAFLNYMFQPENWSKLTWVNGVCMSAQDFSSYLTGSETPVQEDFVGYLTGSTTISGVLFNDLGDSNFKTISENASQEISIGSITDDGFLETLTNACR